MQGIASELLLSQSRCQFIDPVGRMFVDPEQDIGQELFMAPLIEPVHHRLAVSQPVFAPLVATEVFVYNSASRR